MVYTEVQEKNKRKYYYRVISVRKGRKVSKKRKYLGVNLHGKELIVKEKEADRKLVKKRNKETMIEKLKPRIIKVLKKYRVKKAGIFGSFARGEQKKNSYIDILIEAPKGIGLEFVGIKLDLEEELGRKVDLITYKGIHPLIKKQILEDEIKII